MLDEPPLMVRMRGLAGFMDGSFIVSFSSIGSSLPQDSCVFQWDRNAVAVRHHSRRIVRWWADRRHRCAVNVAARRVGQFANARHLLPHGRTAREAIGI